MQTLQKNKFGIIKLITVAAMLVASYPVKADSLQLHGFSWHDSERGGGKGWNENNYGIGYRRELSEDFSIQVGVYRNSIDKTTVYIISDYVPIGLSNNLYIGGFVGFGTGYSSPLLGGAVINAGPLGFRIIPKTRGNPFTIGIEYKVDL